MTATQEVSGYSAERLAEFQNKKVRFVYNLTEPNEKGEGAVEVEGTVEAGNEIGLLVKPRGQVSFKLYQIDQIEPDSIRLVQDKSSKLSRSRIKPVKVGQARRHLLERHAMTLTQVNEMTEEQAEEYHNSIDHEAQDLGHYHGTADEKSDKSEESSDKDAA